MNAVIDTNIWVSGLISSSSAPARVIDAYRLHHFTLITSEPLLKELADVLRRPKIALKYGIAEEDVSGLHKLIRKNAKIVPVFYTVHCCRDPEDDAVIETAIRGQADVIVTGDMDLWDFGDARCFCEIAISKWWALPNFCWELDWVKPGSNMICGVFQEGASLEHVVKVTGLSKTEAEEIRRKVAE